MVKSKHPMQDICKDIHGVVRFNENKIVAWLLDNKKFTMNEIAMLDFSDEDRMQFAQLIGYSVSGYGDLSYASKQSVRKADKKARGLLP